MDKIDLKIMQVMADVFGTSVEELNMDSSQDNLDSWDSVNHLNLITSLEEEFGICISMEDIGIMTNAKIVSTVVKEQMNNA